MLAIFFRAVPCAMGHGHALWLPHFLFLRNNNTVFRIPDLGRSDDCNSSLDGGAVSIFAHTATTLVSDTD